VLTITRDFSQTFIDFRSPICSKEALLVVKHVINSSAICGPNSDSAFKIIKKFLNLYYIQYQYIKITIFRFIRCFLMPLNYDIIQECKK